MKTNTENKKIDSSDVDLLLEQGEKNNPTPLLEIQIEQSEKNTDKIVKAMEGAAIPNAFLKVFGDAFAHGLMSVLKEMKGEPGKDGKDADPEAVAQIIKEDAISKLSEILKNDSEFAALTKGEPGESIQGEPGKDGVSPTVNEVADNLFEKLLLKVVASLKADEEFMTSAKGEKGEGEKGDPGKDGTEITTEQLIKKLKGNFSYDDLKDLPNLMALMNRGRDGSGTTGGVGYLRELSDVDLTGLQPGDSILWDGSKWSIYTPGTGAGANIVDDEIVTPNGVASVFPLAHAPSPATSLKVYMNGSKLTLTSDYSLSGAVLTFTFVPAVTDIIRVDYRY